MADALFIAGASARSAAESARRAGCEIAAADLFCDRDLRACATAQRVSDYPREIVTIAKHLLPRKWIYTGGLENSPQCVAAVSQYHSLLGNPPDVLRHVRNPWRVQQVLRNSRLFYPEIRERLPARRAADETWLCKPRKSNGGAQIRIWPDVAHGDSNSTLFDADMPPADAFYFQQYVRGASYGAVYLAPRKTAARTTVMLLGITRQFAGCRWAGTNGFHHVGAIGPITLDPKLMDQYQRIGQRLATAFGLRGLFGVDTVVERQRVWTIEVNPRFTASVEIHERATGLCAISAHVQACEDTTLPIALPLASPSQPRELHAKATIYAAHSGEVNATFCCWIDAQNSSERFATLADLPQVGTRILAGHPILTVFARGRHMPDVYRQLRAQAGAVKTQFQQCGGALRES